MSRRPNSSTTLLHHIPPPQSSTTFFQHWAVVEVIGAMRSIAGQTGQLLYEDMAALLSMEGMRALFSLDLVTEFKNYLTIQFFNSLGFSDSFSRSQLVMIPKIALLHFLYTMYPLSKLYTCRHGKPIEINETRSE